MSTSSRSQTATYDDRVALYSSTAAHMATTGAGASGAARAACTPRRGRAARARGPVLAALARRPFLLVGEEVPAREDVALERLAQLRLDDVGEGGVDEKRRLVEALEQEIMGFVQM